MPPRSQEQQHEQMLQTMESVARQMHALLQHPVACQVLQQTPPAADPTPAQKELLACSNELCVSVGTVLQRLRVSATPVAARGRAVGLLLRQQAARSLGTLLAWLQQQPEQLRLDLLQQQLQQDQARTRPLTAAEFWRGVCSCLYAMCAALSEAVQAPQPGLNAAALVAAIMQQLEQSGVCLARVPLPLWRLLYAAAVSAAIAQMHAAVAFGVSRTLQFPTHLAFCTGAQCASIRMHAM